MNTKRIAILVTLFGVIFALILSSTSPASAAVTTINDNDAGITYSGWWGIGSDSFLYGGNSHYTNDPSATVSYTFTGVGINVMYTQQPSGAASLDVYVDDELIGTINENGSAFQPQTVWESSELDNEEHVLRLEYAGSGWLDIDALQVVDDTPTPTPSPTATAAPGGLRCSGTSGVDYGPWAICDPEEELEPTKEITGGVTANYESYFDVEIINAIPRIYYDIYITWNVIYDPGRPVWLEAPYFKMELLTTGASYLKVCSEFNCHFYGYFDANEEVPGARFKFTIYDLWPNDTLAMSAGEAKLSVNPIINCDDYIAKWSEDLDIDPTVELPNGVGPFPPDPPKEPDQQKMSLEVGKFYRLTTTGIWNDGAADRPDHDFAVSFDNNETWIPIENMTVVCEDIDGQVFEAETTYFSIRVDDTAENFADNTDLEGEDTRYTISEVTETTECGQKFSYDPVEDLVYSGEIESNSEWSSKVPEVGATGTLEIGEWYAIETYGSPWVDDTSTDRFDFKITSTMETTAYEMSIWPYTSCTEPTGELSHMRYYFQTPDPILSTWANSETFSSNTGNLAWRLYHVDYTYIPADCESVFVINDKITTDFVYAQAENGSLLVPDVVLPPKVYQNGYYYMIETRDGPWLQGDESRHYDMAAGQNAVADGDKDFFPLETWEEGICYAKIDMLGHERVYFKYDAPLLPLNGYYMAVNDEEGDYNDNNEWLGYDVYETTKITTPPGDCGNISLGDYRGIIPVPPDREAGVSAPPFVAEQSYALETSGQWSDGEGDPISTAAISDDGGTTWYDWPDYPNKICFETFIYESIYGPIEHYRLYLKAQAGKSYMIRALDGDSNWGNNEDTNEFSVKWYETIVDDPWNSCEDNYSLTKIDANVQIPSQLDSGVRTKIIAGNLYAVDIISGSWKASSVGEDQYKAQMNFASGAGDSWYAFDDRTMPGFQCYGEHGNYERVYFKATMDEGAYAHVRVADEDDWTNNSGELRYDLYSAVSTCVGEDCPDPPDCPECVPTPQDVGCYTVPMRPGWPALSVYLPLPADSFTVSLPEFPEFPGIADIPALGAWLADVFEFFLDAIGSMVQDAWTNLGVLANWGKDIVSALINSLSVNIQKMAGYAVGWVEYARASFTGFWLWCPEHSAFMTELNNQIQQREPFSTYIKIKGFIIATKAKFDSFEWTVGSNSAVMPFVSAIRGSSSYTAANQNPSLLQTVTAGSPYNGGQLALTPVNFGALRGSGGDPTVCTANIRAAWGTSGLSKGFCVVMNLTKLTGLDFYINSAIVIGCVLIFLRYLGERIFNIFLPSIILGGKGRS